MTLLIVRNAALRAGLSLCVITGASNASLAQKPASYTDFRNEVVTFPLGPASFVDRVHSIVEGSKKPLESERDPEAVLGEPDYEEAGDGRAYSLGCRGEVAFEFTDNAIVDVAGADLYVFEVGQDVEPTNLALSNDGHSWEEIGQIAGGKISLDLADHGLSGRDFRFVRLQDTGKFCDGRWPGADIDAIGAIGSATRFRLDSQVLFDFDKAELKPGAGATLDQLIGGLGKIAFSRLAVVGHTDSQGTDDYNQDLSERRAQAVADYLTQHSSGVAAGLAVSGRGETEPIDTNETEVGRAANRRVEVIAVPQ